MNQTIFYPFQGDMNERLTSLHQLLKNLQPPYNIGDSVAVKLHWGERGNTSFLPPHYAREIVHWLNNRGMKPFIFDTTVLYSGGRRTASDSSRTPTCSRPRRRPRPSTVEVGGPSRDTGKGRFFARPEFAMRSFHTADIANTPHPKLRDFLGVSSRPRFTPRNSNGISGSRDRRRG